MHRNPALRRISLAAAAASAVVLLSACGSQATGAGSTGAASQSGEVAATNAPLPNESASFNDADVAFAQMMIPDHEMTAKMGELAQKKAASKELKSLAVDLQQGESEAVDKLGGLLQDWGKPTSGDMAGMDMPGAMTDKDMGMLESMNGMEFDMMFAEMMIKHHEGSLKMARDEQAKGANPDAKAMAADMLERQQAQVDKLRKIAQM